MSASRPFRFGVLASNARSSSEWTETARKAEDLGYSTLVMPDHFGDQLSPIAALATAAAVTESLRVGTLVFASDFRHPAVLAKEAATLDLLSNGVGEGRVGPAAIASMSADATDEKLGWVRDAAGERFDDIEISILKFVTVVTDDRDAVAAKVGGSMGMDAASLLASPHTVVGSAEQIADELIEQRERWQGSYVTVRSDAFESFAPVVAALAGT